MLLMCVCVCVCVYIYIYRTAAVTEKKRCVANVLLMCC
jgi:hypothetical protein